MSLEGSNKAKAWRISIEIVANDMPDAGVHEDELKDLVIAVVMAEILMWWVGNGYRFEAVKR